jgi:hypothetical protein
MTTQVSFITKQEYLNGLNQQVGSLMFSSELYDCLSLVDRKQLRKDFKTQLANKRVYAVLIHTNRSRVFKNIKNPSIKYKYSAFCDKDSDGAVFEDGNWVYRNPVGDAIIVYTEIKQHILDIQNNT